MVQFTGVYARSLIAALILSTLIGRQFEWSSATYLPFVLFLLFYE